MNKLLEKAQESRRRMVVRDTLVAFFRVLPWTLGACTLMFLVDWIGYLGIHHLAWLAGALALPVPLAFLMAYRRRPSLVQAALALDLGSVTQERLSTALSLPDPETPMERSVVDDASAWCEKIDVSRTVPLFVPPRWKWLIAALLPMGILFFDRPGWDLFGRREDAAREEERKTQSAEIKKHGDKLKKKADKFEEKVRNAEMKNAQELGEKMKQIAREMQKETMTKKEVVARLSGLEESVKRRWEEMGSKSPTAKDLKNKLQSGGSADRGIKSEKTAADLEKAIDEIGKLKQELEKQDLTKEEAAKAQEKLDSLSKSMERMGVQSPEALKELIEQLSKMQGGESVDPKDLAEDMKSAENDLSEMAKDLSEMGMMEMAMGDLQDLKDKLLDLEKACKVCGKMEEGEGDLCEKCKGVFGEGILGKGSRDDEGGKGGGGGDGAGLGGGMGPTPNVKGKEHEKDKSKVKSPLSPGEIISAVRLKAMPSKGKAGVEYQDSYESARSEAQDAMAQEEIPPGYRAQIRDYFDAVKPKK